MAGLNNDVFTSICSVVVYDALSVRVSHLDCISFEFGTWAIYVHHNNVDLNSAHGHDGHRHVLIGAE